MFLMACHESEERDIDLKVPVILKHFLCVPAVILVELLEEIECFDPDMAIRGILHANFDNYWVHWPIVKI